MEQKGGIKKGQGSKMYMNYTEIQYCRIIWVQVTLPRVATLLDGGR